MIGGPKCGQVVDVPDGAVSYVTYEERPFSLGVFWPEGDSVIPPLPRTTHYRIDRYTACRSPLGVTKVALVPVGYCWEKPSVADITWHVEANPLLLDAMNLEWRSLP